MSISLVSLGAYTAVAVGNKTPVAGSAYVTGDALIYITGEFLGSDDVTTPAGWSLLSVNTVHTVKIFGKIATSSSETIPTVTWGASNPGYAVLNIFRGVDSTLTVVGSGDRAANQTLNLLGPAGAITPSVAGAVGIFAGNRNKTLTTNSCVYSAPTNWTIGNQVVPAGTTTSAANSYWIQTAATATATNLTMAGSGTPEGTTQAGSSTVVFLKPAPPPTGGGGGITSFPPLKRKTYVFYDNYYPR